MGHLIHSKDEVYAALAERLNRNPVGAPVNEDLMGILHSLYTETEATVASKLPLKPMTLERIASITDMDGEKVKAILDGMADKGLVIDIPRRDTCFYTLAPMVVGFFEYTFMRTRENVNMGELAGLFERYFLNPEVLKEFSGTAETKLMRTLVYESLIPMAVDTDVLDYEKASRIIRASGGGAISLCACRHKAAHLGKACGAPTEVCTSFGMAGEWILRRGLGKPATVDDLLKVLDDTEKLGLVHTCDNVLNEPAFLCHCCGCCCTVLRPIAAAGDAGLGNAHPSNFAPSLDEESCTGCAICVEKCPVHAITMSTKAGSRELPRVNGDACIGCGVCSAFCPAGSRTMCRRDDLHVPPAHSRELSTRIIREKNRQ